jgi:hypothetical protein
MTLIELASGYLEADGYSVTRRGRSLVVGNRPTIGEETDFIYVWVSDSAALRSFASQEGPMLKSFAEVASTHPRSTRFFLVPTTEGISGDFRKQALELDVRVRVPGQFLDTEFKWERSPDSASAIRELVLRAEDREIARVEQPYKVRGSQPGDDALDHVVSRFAGRRPVQIVIGPAGSGKSILFDAVLARLYNQFVEAKRSQQLAARPLPLTPASVGQPRTHSRRTP